MDVLIVDVTVLVGLLFFISLQSFSSAATEQVHFDVWTKINDIKVENIETQLLIERLCNNSKINLENIDFILKPSSKCDEWYNIIYLNDVKVDAIEKRIFETFEESGGITIDKFNKSSSFYLFGGPLLAAGVSFSMIIPFTISAIFVSINAFFRKEQEDMASKYGVIAMISGFFMVILGIIIFISLMFCTVFLNWNCGVEQTLSGIMGFE